MHSRFYAFSTSFVKHVYIISNHCQGVNKKKHFFTTLPTLAASTRLQANNCSVYKKTPGSFRLLPGSSLREESTSCGSEGPDVNRQPRTRTIVRVAARPDQKGRPRSRTIYIEDGSGIPIQAPINPNNLHIAPQRVPIIARSPRTGRPEQFNQSSVIFRYILCFMFDYVYIWCDVHHARLGQTLELSQFVRNFLLG